MGYPRAGASNKGGVGEISHFLPLSVNISKTYQIRLQLLLMTNRKSHMGFRLTPRSMTLDDLECCKVEFSRNFALFRVFGRLQQLNECK